MTIKFRLLQSRARDRPAALQTVARVNATFSDKPITCTVPN